MLGADLGCCLQREGLEALYCPPVPHTSYPLSCVSPLIYPCPRVSWPLATAAAAPMDRPARDSAPDAHSLARAWYICLCPTFRDPTGLDVCFSRCHAHQSELCSD